MISYDLQCAFGHRFEGWFGSSADFEKQQQSGLLDCPTCGSTDVMKCLSAPNVGRKGNQVSSVPSVKSKEMAESDAATLSNVPELPAELKEAIDKVAQIQAESLKDSKWVGGKFAEEARAIHYGETESRIIHGEASADEAEALAEEGVAIMPLLFPVLPPEAKN